MVETAQTPEKHPQEPGAAHGNSIAGLSRLLTICVRRGASEDWAAGLPGRASGSCALQTQVARLI